jgi:hypothetical protein
MKTWYFANGSSLSFMETDKNMPINEAQQGPRNLTFREQLERQKELHLNQVNKIDSVLDILSANPEFEKFIVEIQSFFRS